MVEKTITIAIDANVQKFKRAMADAKSSVKATGTAVKKDTEKISKGIEEAGKGSRFKAFAESIKGISPTLDGVIGSITEMGDRMQKAGTKGKLAMMGVKLAVAGLAVGIVAMLGKAIMDATGKFAKLADPVRFDQATSEMKESLRTLKTSIGELASPVFEYMAKGVSALAKGLTWVVEKLAQFVGFLQGLLGLGHKVNQTLNGTAGAMAEAGASADAGLASFDKLNTLNTDEMGDMEQVSNIAGMMDKMRKAGEDSAKSIAEMFAPIRELLDMDAGEVWDRFKESARGAWESVKEWASSTWQGIRESVSGVWSGMVGWASSAWDSVGRTASEMWDRISTKAHEVWTGITTWILNGFKTVGNTLKGIFTGVVDVFKRAWDRVFGGIKGAIDWVLDKIRWVSDKISGLRESVSRVGEKVGGFIGGIGEKVKGVLGFAKGGVFQPNSPQLALLGDNQTEPEVVAPKSMIKEAVAEVMSEMGGGSGGSSKGIPITLTIDGKVLARYMYDDLQSVSRQKGRGTIA